MAGNLTYPDGLPITLQFIAANIVENATTNLTLGSGGVGITVPTGYKFHPVMLFAESNAEINTDSAALKVTANTTALVNGPSVTLDANTQTGYSTARVGAEGIAAGKVIGVNAVVGVNFAPNTLDIDAVLVGILLPA